MSVAAPSFQTQDLAHDEPQDYLWTLNFGPQHPATHTTLRLVLKLDGERVVDAMPDIGYLHSGFEKLGEHLDYNQYVTVTDRMNYISPMANNVAWHLAVERLLGIEITPRCKYIRTIIAELARISDHLLCNGAVGLDVGAFTYFLYAFYQREVLYDIFETLCGARFTNSYTRVGGLMYDITPLVIEKIRRFLGNFSKTLEDMERLLNRNKIFVDRTKGVGVLTKDEAINRSASGPIARASGVTRDLRKDEPYLSYSDFEFKVCCATAGDCYARYLVRMAEMRESMKIVEQALENLPEGPVNVGIDQRTALPTKQMVYSTIEGTISHFELVMSNRGFEVPYEESYAAIEAPNGELGFYLVGNGTDVAYRARCRPPSFIHFALFPDLIRGHTLSDIVAVLGSLNIIAAELDKMIATERILTDEMVSTITALFPRYPTKQAVTLPALHIVNERLRHVPLQAVVEIAELLELAPAEVQDTLSFYGIFKQDKPHGHVRAWVCRSISCALRGGEEILEHLCHAAGIHPGETTNDGALTVEYAECLGACEYAPCMLANQSLHKDLTRDKADVFLREVRQR